MKKIFLVLGLSVLILGFSITIFTYVHAQTEGTYGAKFSTFNYVQVFSAPDNKVGLFDNRDGKIYIYNTDSNSCEKILQLRELGNPLLQIR